MKLTANECLILSELLDLAADEFSNKGCNDFRLANTDANWALLMSLYQADHYAPEDIPSRPPFEQKIIFYDWWLMRHFAKRFKEESKQREP